MRLAIDDFVARKPDDQGVGAQDGMPDGGKVRAITMGALTRMQELLRHLKSERCRQRL